MNIRPRIPFVLAAGLATIASHLVAEPGSVRMGDTPESVIRELGKPKGRISSGSYEVYIYDRGKVEFVSNLVSGIDLFSAEQLEEQRVEQEKRRQAEISRQEAAAQLAREAQERRRTEGQSIVTGRLADTAFRAQAAGDQLAYWDRFKAQYPEADIADVYDALLRQYQTEVEQARLRQQLAEFQQRTAEAEAQAARAEKAARKAEEAYYWARPVYYVPMPVIQHPPHQPCQHSCTHTCQPVCTKSQQPPVRSRYMIPPKPGPTPYILPTARFHQGAGPPVATGLTSRSKSQINCK